jgi:hypothetical protein
MTTRVTERAAVDLLVAAKDTRLLNMTPSPRQLEMLKAIRDHRLTVVCAGRRGGKTRTDAGAAVHNLLLSPQLDRLVGPREIRRAVAVAASAEQATQFLLAARGFVEDSPVLRGQLVAVKKYDLIFRGNKILSAFPTTARSTRGWAISYLAFLELAHLVDLTEGPAAQRQLVTALTPSVAQFGELGRIVIESTPLASDDYFSETFHKAETNQIPNATAFRGTTLELNPKIDEETIEADRIMLGEAEFQREYEAIFTEGGTGFLEAGFLRNVIVPGRRELMPPDGRGWLACIDPSFRVDPSALVIVGRSHGGKELLVARAKRWLPPKPPKRRKGQYRSPQEQAKVTGSILDAIADEIRPFMPCRIFSDQHDPGGVVHGLGERGLHVAVKAWTAAEKTQSFQALRARVNRGAIELLDIEQLTTELLRVQTQYKAGSAGVITPRIGDSHSDLAIALAAAVWELDRYGDGLSEDFYRAWDEIRAGGGHSIDDDFPDF